MSGRSKPYAAFTNRAPTKQPSVVTTRQERDPKLKLQAAKDLGLTKNS